MEDRDVSSEEKLLKVIRSQDKIRQKKESAGTAAQTSSGSGSASFSLGILVFFNKIFIVAAIALFSLATYRYFTLVEDFGDIKETSFLSSENVGGGFNKISGFLVPKDAPVQSRVLERDLFEAPWEKPQPVVEVPESGVEVNPAPDLTSVFRLAGIIMDQNESQVIVEDLRQGETIFVPLGQEVLGARLVEIFEDRAVFIYQNERVELTP